jgi:hypothetical protein
LHLLVVCLFFGTALGESFDSAVFILLETMW